ncbi:1-acyl-sn-glycerol-3-phosphate acyltransferase [Calidifontibacter sp. DB0510]|uniref:1-acyl-sn-glycerol-3-phosphate acyltransferase n=1 Tax=Metallococcus carri TaxID=1656884 RepID=A0A967B115_9MICO|nr:lysophospholipid acyltransferase family protein [Metallococcus carri]NHN55300.1 1-acyl-sn-glycerol-3-phosphate acyltransferase [Metallococcus carri]NOP36377.1 1-acyl-sn-glycerol-3-phosphate acyltransferase [Calidifontibacter sp. DB2511S]
MRPDRLLKHAAGIAVVWLGSQLAHRVRFGISDAIPSDGPVIIVANHLTTTEPLAVARLVLGHRRFPHFLAMREVFSWPVIGWLARGTGQIPVARGTASAAEALAGASEQLAAGRVVALYPEGRLTDAPDQMPGPGRTGAARLALLHPAVPVIPVGTWGPKQGRAHRWHRHTACLCVGEPVDLSAYAGRTDERAAQEATAVIMAAIRAQVVRAQGEYRRQRRLAALQAH